MSVASRRKAALRSRRRNPYGPSGSSRAEPFDGPYRVALWTDKSIGFSGIAFWQFFDRLPRYWRNRINYALTPSGMISEYHAACNDVAQQGQS